MAYPARTPRRSSTRRPAGWDASRRAGASSSSTAPSTAAPASAGRSGGSTTSASSPTTAGATRAPTRRQPAGATWPTTSTTCWAWSTASPVAGPGHRGRPQPRRRRGGRRGPGRAGPVRLHRRLRAADAMARVPPDRRHHRPLAAARRRPGRRGRAVLPPHGRRRRLGAACPKPSRARRRAEGPALVADLAAIRGRRRSTSRRCAVPVVFGRGGPASAAHHRETVAWLADHVPGAQLDRDPTAPATARTSPTPTPSPRFVRAAVGAGRRPATGRRTRRPRDRRTGPVNILLSGSHGLIGRALAVSSPTDGHGSSRSSGRRRRAPTEPAPSVAWDPARRHRRPGGARRAAALRRGRPPRRGRHRRPPLDRRPPPRDPATAGLARPDCWPALLPPLDPVARRPRSAPRPSATTATGATRS